MWRGPDIEVDETKEMYQCGKKGQKDLVVYVDSKKPNILKENT